MIQHKHNRAIAGRIVIQQTAPAPTFSTQMQSPSFRRRILDAARRDGSLHELFWMIEFRAPVRTLPPTIKPPGAIMGSVVFAASFPGKWIPVIPVGSDPLASQEYAELLKGLLYAKNRTWVQEIGVALTNRDVMQGYKWYEWGDRLPPGDEFCRKCGGVGECVCDASRLALVASSGRLHLSRAASGRYVGATSRARGGCPRSNDGSASVWANWIYVKTAHGSGESLNAIRRPSFTAA